MVVRSLRDVRALHDDDQAGDELVTGPVRLGVGAGEEGEARLGTVRLASGPHVIVRLAGDAAPGQRVRLRVSEAAEGVAPR